MPADPAEPVVRTVMVRPRLPDDARQPCERPVLLPDAALTASVTVSLWGRDRAALRICEARRAAIITAVEGGQK